ncbi:hypothetical protein FLL46_26400 [Aliikangiella coralliicola]|uniref:Uncharacterized protein n=2 Tax=Aliikangiella coralliicola TaxID=2592383 RepID=A0A545TSV1_9GAMM|nr:hypothetical protein FLL46_26400 [Aliikangiella coralliicola]
MFVCFFSFSGKVGAASDWTGEVTVKSIYTLNETRALIELSSFNNPGNCKVNSSGHIILDPSTHKTWFSMFLTAYAAKKPLNVYVAEACTEVWPGTSYGNIGHVRLL